MDRRIGVYMQIATLRQYIEAGIGAVCVFATPVVFYMVAVACGVR